LFIVALCIPYSAFQIDELHRHKQSLVETLHFHRVTSRSVVCRHENCCKYIWES